MELNPDSYFFKQTIRTLIFKSLFFYEKDKVFLRNFCGYTRADTKIERHFMEEKGLAEVVHLAKEDERQSSELLSSA